MTNHHNVFFRIQFLMCARWNIAHRHSFAPAMCAVSNSQGLADIEQRESLAQVKL